MLDEKANRKKILSNIDFQYLKDDVKKQMIQKEIEALGKNKEVAKIRRENKKSGSDGMVTRRKLR